MSSCLAFGWYPAVQDRRNMTAFTLSISNTEVSSVNLFGSCSCPRMIRFNEGAAESIISKQKIRRISIRQVDEASIFHLNSLLQLTVQLQRRSWQQWSDDENTMKLGKHRHSSTISWWILVSDHISLQKYHHWKTHKVCVALCSEVTILPCACMPNLCEYHRVSMHVA